MRASPRTELIVIEVRSVADDGYGGEAETWDAFAEEYAAVYYGSGSEQRAAAQQSGSQVAQFEVLENADTRAISIIDHRIGFDNSIWNITAKQRLGRDGIRISAIRAVQ